MVNVRVSEGRFEEVLVLLGDCFGASHEAPIGPALDAFDERASCEDERAAAHTYARGDWRGEIRYLTERRR